MKIETIDIYWAKLPLAFVWKTSYADQHYTDTILVRMEGGGHYAWGESRRGVILCQRSPSRQISARGPASPGRTMR